MNTKTSMNLESLETLIRTHPFLEGMTPHQHRILASCAMRAHFDRGETVFRAGDPANRFYLILNGKVALESQGKGRSMVAIQTIGAGEVLGWSWLFPPYIWHFDASATEPTEAVFIYGTPLREECQSDHELGYELMRRMAEVMLARLQATRWQLLGLGEAGS